VYGIVKQSGGHAEVYSEPGRGTTFKIYFPLVNRPVTVSLPHVSPTSSGGTETILLVEDEQALRDMVTKVLTSRGYRVIPAASAEEAEQISSSNSTIDLLLTDVVMPRVSGTELGTRIARRYPRIKVLYMSGYTANSMQPGQVNDLGHSFLEKPFTPQALAEKVREVLDTKQQ
jgi:DNA-binding NtrC family response regulator